MNIGMSSSTTTLIQEGKMSLILEAYVDIFSSFDPRPYSERALSDDFLDECKKIVSDKSSPMDVIELRLLIPERLRIFGEEEVIKKRLHAYFAHQLHIQQKIRHKDTLYGSLFVVLGVTIGIIVSYILHKHAFTYMYTTLITVIGEPASWIFIWNGADKLLQYFRGEKDEAYMFAYRLSHAKIQFYGY